MKPLFVLVFVFVIAILATKLTRGHYEMALSGRIAMAAMLLFTALAHFAFTKGMAMMLPDFVPEKNFVVYLTGCMEIAAAIGILIPSLQILTGWLLIALFILMLPANIYAALNHIDYQKGTDDGYGLAYLWFRVPLQIIFILWIYFSAIKIYTWSV